jgi:hypothetical protein
MVVPRIFISYRRSDTQDVAGRLYDRLAPRFGANNVFKDVSSTRYGSDFRERLADAINHCNVMLVLIGERWISITDEHGQRRLDQPDDFVRMELEAALSRGIRIIPILAGDVQIPVPRFLPESLRRLASLQATRLRPDPDFNDDYERLIRELTGAAPARLSGRLMATATGAALCITAVAFGVPYLRDYWRAQNIGTESPPSNSAPKIPLVSADDLTSPMPPPAAAPHDDFEMSGVIPPLSSTPESPNSVQMRFGQPDGMQIGWQIPNGYAENQLVTPSRFPFYVGGTYRLKFSNFPAGDGLVLYPSLEISRTTATTEEYLRHNVVPLNLAKEDFKVIESGKLLVQVIYLPDSQNPASEGRELNVVSSRTLPSNADPVREASKLGTIVAIIRIGNVDLEMPIIPRPKA